jgi:excisionase family DNA binding protein
MEKICIVKRRQQYLHLENKPALHEISNSILKSEDLMIDFELLGRKSSTRESVFEELNNDSCNKVSITMTPEQSNMLQEAEFIKKMLDGTFKDPAFSIHRNAAGRIVLNFRLNVAMHLRMLRSDQVCTMLQISRSLLSRMIREHKIKSYKICRLRRFLLQDILEYLLSNKEFTDLRSMT